MRSPHSLILLTLLSINFYLTQSRNLRDSSTGHDLADCSCKCCSGEVQRQDIACDVDVILLISAAACVKDYIENMKVTAKRMIDDIYAMQGSVNEENGLNLIGSRARIGIITYSSKPHVVSDMGANLGADELR